MIVGGCCWKSADGYTCINPRETEQACLDAEGGAADAETGGVNLFFANAACGDDNCNSLSDADGGDEGGSGNLRT